MPRILAVAEQRDGALRRLSDEIVTAARTLAEAASAEVDVLVAGSTGIGSAASGLAKFGAAKLLVAESDALKQYAPDVLAQLIADVAKKGDYVAIVFGASSIGKDLAPRVAAKVDVPLAADAIGVAFDGGKLTVKRPVYAGRALATVTLDATPGMVSIRPNVFRPQERPAAGAVEQVAVPSVEQRVKVREVRAAAGAKVDVGEAPIVVSGGRGMKGPENWHLLEDLRDAIGHTCALGASRAVVDAGWRPHGEQVGQTGKTVAPQLYFAIGISGAMQHLAGIRSARTVVAINKDPEAPIFKVADYGIVGDATEVVPRLTEELKKL